MTCRGGILTNTDFLARAQSRARVYFPKKGQSWTPSTPQKPSPPAVAGTATCAPPTQKASVEGSSVGSRVSIGPNGNVEVTISVVDD